MKRIDWADETADALLWAFMADDDVDASREAIGEALRAAYLRGRIAGLREGANIASSFPASYDDGVSLHAENMTAARIVLDLRNRADALERGDK